jgi:thioredoxin 1
MMLHVLPFFLAVAGLTAGGQAPPAPGAPPAQAVQRAPVQAPPPFDEKADAKAAIESAIRAAGTDDIRVLVTWGANDDAGSKLFVAARRAPEVAGPRFFSDEYKSVSVDIGHLDKNLDLARSYGARLKAETLPALTVIDAAGKVIANTDAAALRPDADPAGIDPVKLAVFLKSHQAPAPDAVALFEAALKQAKKEGKTVFVWFAAPW